MFHRTRRRVAEAAGYQHRYRQRKKALTHRLKRQLKSRIKPATARVAAQIECHRVFDRLWCGPEAVMPRRRAYEYLQRITCLPSSDAHISRLSADECYGLIEKVREDYPRIFRKSA
jgi:hypothetical protein